MGRVGDPAIVSPFDTRPVSLWCDTGVPSFLLAPLLGRPSLHGVLSKQHKNQTKGTNLYNAFAPIRESVCGTRRGEREREDVARKGF